MSTTNPAFLAFLEQQCAEYRASLPGRTLQIESLWQQVLNGEAPAQALATLERVAHSLAGSGATFGFAAMGDVARILELAVNPLAQTDECLTPEVQATLNRAVEALLCSLRDTN